MYKQEFVGPILQLIQEHCPDVSPQSSTALQLLRQWVWCEGCRIPFLLTLVDVKECLP